MHFAATIFILALTASAAFGQNFNGAVMNCGTNNGGCAINCAGINGVGITYNFFSGGTGSSSYTYILSNTENINAYAVTINTQNNPAPLYIQLSSGFSISNLYIGANGYLSTTGGFSQSSIVLNMVNLYMYASSLINDTSIKVRVYNYTDLDDGASVNLGSMMIANGGEIGNVNFATSVGLMISAVVVATNTNFNIGGDFVIQNPDNSDPTQTTALTCLGNTQINANNAHAQAPTSTLNCNLVVSDTLYFHPASGCSDGNGNNPVASGTSAKRDGSTTSTTFNNGSSNANSVVQTTNYVNSLLTKRNAKDKRDLCSNQVVLRGSHQMQINSGLCQDGIDPTITVATCTCQVNMRFTTGTIQQACPGCETSCTNQVFKTAMASRKRGDEQILI